MKEIKKIQWQVRWYWFLLVGGRWQRFQGRVAGFYFQRVTLPVRFWRACGCPVQFRPRLPWWQPFVWRWLVISGSLRPSPSHGASSISAVRPRCERNQPFRPWRKDNETPQPTTRQRARREPGSAGLDVRPDEVSSLTLDETSVRAPLRCRAQTPRTTNALQRQLPRPGFCIQFLRLSRSGACGPSGAHHRLTPRCAGSANTPLPPNISASRQNGGGRGARSAPLCAPTRPPSPNFRGQRQHQLASLEEGVRWNAPLSLRYVALTRASQRPASRGSTPGQIESAASDAWRRKKPNSASRRRRRNSRGPRDTRRPKVQQLRRTAGQASCFSLGRRSPAR